MQDIFTVIYWVGGTERGEWRLTSQYFGRRGDARGLADDIEHTGYVALTFQVAELCRSGIPGSPAPERIQRVLALR